MRRNENSPPVNPEMMPFQATDVTGTLTIDVDVRRDLPAEEMARMLANRLSLPDGEYALRDEASSVYLDEDRAIGEQISPNALIAVTPRTHLG